MSKTQVQSRAGVVAVAACGLLALSACSSGGSTDASSSSATPSATSSTGSTSSTSPSVSRSVLSPSSSAGASSSAKRSTKPTGAASSSGKSSTASKSTKPTETKKPVKADPVGACVTANKKSNAAISQWNTAVSSQSSSKLDAAAKNFQTTATNLRKLTSKAQDKGFTSRAKTVAHDLDVMAQARFDGKTVATSTYNADSKKLTSYCQKLITKG